MERAYIAELSQAYEDFFDGHLGPSLRIDTTTLNIVQNPAHLKLVENRIREALGITPFQPSLPFESGD
jgi:deoxyadenosine/deoxycytidine kinase